MNKVLIISYYWPPSGGAGVQRWLKFCKYLPVNNWQPVVLTVDPKYASYPQKDDSLLSDVHAACKVFKTKSFEINNIYKTVSSNKEVPYGGFANEAKPTLFKKIARFIRGNVFLPDARVGWNKYAIKEAQKIINEENINVVVTTGPPQSTHLIGLYLKKNLGVNWVADLRDPWTDIYYYSMMYHTKLARKKDLKYQFEVLKYADKVTTVSYGFAELFKKHYSNLTRKLYVIPNGFDFKDLTTKTNDKSQSVFYITYVGTISLQYRLNGLIDAIKGLPKTLQNKIVLRFVGADLEIIKGILDIETLPCKVETLGYVPHSEAVGYMQKSHIVLLVVPEIKNSEGIVPGKLFEYIGSKSTVMAIGAQGSDIFTILEEVNAGKMFTYDQDLEMKKWLQAMMNGEISYSSSSNQFNKYSRSELTKKMVSVLESVSN